MRKIILITALSIACLVTNGQEFLAKVRMNCESGRCATGLVFKKDDLIVVFKPFETTNNWYVWTSYGANGCLDTSQFQIIPDRPIFKLVSSAEDLKKQACTEHVKNNFNLINVNYCSIVSRITNKDLKALTEFFDLIPKVDAALSEIHADDTWPLINLISDNELLSWLEMTDSIRIKQFINYLKEDFVAFPITRYAEYLNNYYPHSWKILKKYN